MKLPYIFLLSALLLAGCGTPAGGTDYRFSGLPSTIVVIDDYPIAVTVLKVSDTVFDVEAKEGRAIAFTGINEPLAYYDRYRRGAMKQLRTVVGENVKIRTVSEIMPPQRLRVSRILCKRRGVAV